MTEIWTAVVIRTPYLTASREHEALYCLAAPRHYGRKDCIAFGVVAWGMTVMCCS